MEQVPLRGPYHDALPRPTAELTAWKNYLPIRAFKETWKRESINEERSHFGKANAVFIKWAAPMAFTGLCTFICMVWLHFGTYYYVHHMNMMTTLFKRNRTVDEGAFPVELSMGWRATSETLIDRNGHARSLSYGSLNDPFEGYLGFAEVDISFLDKIAACFPLLFVILAVLQDELGIWTKVMLCNALLALLKGAFGAMTTVPDSKGWRECKERLGPVGLDWMMQVHDESADFISMEIFGVDGNRLRWCADMLFSGHTYFTTLYALGLYELSYNFTKEWAPLARKVCLGIVAVVAVGEQCVEIYFVLLNRFHYTMDVALAVLLTFLFFTNGGVAEASKRWVWFGLNKYKVTSHWDRSTIKEVHRWRNNVPHSLQHAIGSDRETKEEALEDARDAEFDVGRLNRGVVILPIKDLMSDADTFIPWCMNPFFACYALGCCGKTWKFWKAWGETCGTTRHHCYDDADLGDMLTLADEEAQHYMCEHMRISLREHVVNHKNNRALVTGTTELAARW